MGNPVNACMGLFVLWWGWLAFNSGSTYGVSGAKWQYAARAAVMTMMGSFGGGFYSLIYSMVRNDGRMDIVDLINGILGSLVSVTAGCFLYNAWEAILIGAIGSFLTCITMPIFDKLKIDDPVGASSVHGICGIWGVIAVGLFADNPVPLGTTNERSGLFKGGGWYLLGIQSLSALCLLVWGISSTFFLLWSINKFVPIRMDENEELLGADLMEHRIRHSSIGISRALSALAPLHHDLKHVKNIPKIGINPGHENALDEIRIASQKLEQWKTYVDTMTPSRKKTHFESNITGSPRGNKSFNRRKTGGQTTSTESFGLSGTFKATNLGEDNPVATISNRVINQEQGNTSDQNFAWVD